MKEIEAVEIFSSAVCNLNCKYCYIPKNNNVSSKVHKLIIEKIKNGEYIKQIKETVGDNLTSLCHWGTEPTLTLSIFKNFYTEILREFPKFRAISFSTNLMTNPMILVDFIKNFPKTEREIKFKIQISLDGPSWITDINRINGSADTIVNNLITLVKELGSDIPSNYRVELLFKATHDNTVISKMTDRKMFDSYCEFFDDVIFNVNKNIKSNQITLNPNCQPSIVVPGQYTKEDGLNYFRVFSYFNETFNEKKYHNAYLPIPFYSNFNLMIKSLDLAMIGRASLGCSAGKTMLAINHKDDVYVCHRLFHDMAPEFKESIDKFFETNDSYLGYNDGTDKNELLNKFAFKINNEFDKIKMLYLTKGLSDNHKFKISSGISLIKELALSGLISKEYLYDEQLCFFLIIFMMTRECCVDSIIATGSAYLTCPSLIKLFGNGAFELLYHNLCEGKNV